MNKIFLTLVILIYNYSNAQEPIKNDPIPGVIKKNLKNVKTFSLDYIYSDNVNACYSGSDIELKKRDVVIMAGVLFCPTENKFYFKAIFRGNNVLVDTSDIATESNISEKFDDMDMKQYRNYLDGAFLADKTLMALDTLNAKKQFLEICKQGLVIVSDKVYDESEYTSGTGFKVEILNASTKTIKYITFNYVGYNSVDDPVQQFGKSLLTLKGIGPIKSFETSTYDKEYAWLTDIVQYEYIKSITVQYMDGTSRVFKNIKSITLNDRVKKYLEMDN